MTANCTVNRTVMGHINLHKRSVCAVDFVNYIDRILGQETSAIYGLQEPNVNPNTSRLSDIANSSLIYCRNSTRGNLPRAALFSTSNIILAPVPDFIDRDISTALLTTRSKNSDLKRIPPDLTGKKMLIYSKNERKKKREVLCSVVQPDTRKKAVSI